MCVQHASMNILFLERNTRKIVTCLITKFHLVFPTLSKETLSSEVRLRVTKKNSHDDSIKGKESFELQSLASPMSILNSMNFS
jgi:hypothetical protein